MHHVRTLVLTLGLMAAGPIAAVPIKGSELIEDRNLKAMITRYRDMCIIGINDVQLKRTALEHLTALCDHNAMNPKHGFSNIGGSAPDQETLQHMKAQKERYEHLCSAGKQDPKLKEHAYKRYLALCDITHKGPDHQFPGDEAVPIVKDRKIPFFQLQNNTVDINWNDTRVPFFHLLNNTHVGTNNTGLHLLNSSVPFLSILKNASDLNSHISDRPSDAGFTYFLRLSNGTIVKSNSSAYNYRFGPDGSVSFISLPDGTLGKTNDTDPWQHHRIESEITYLPLPNGSIIQTNITWHPSAYINDSAPFFHLSNDTIAHHRLPNDSRPLFPFKNDTEMKSNITDHPHLPLLNVSKPLFPVKNDTGVKLNITNNPNYPHLNGSTPTFILVNDTGVNPNYSSTNEPDLNGPKPIIILLGENNVSSNKSDQPDVPQVNISTPLSPAKNDTEAKPNVGIGNHHHPDMSTTYFRLPNGALVLSNSTKEQPHLDESTPLPAKNDTEAKPNVGIGNHHHLDDSITAFRLPNDTLVLSNVTSVQTYPTISTSLASAKSDTPARPNIGIGNHHHPDMSTTYTRLPNGAIVPSNDTNAQPHLTSSTTFTPVSNPTFPANTETPAKPSATDIHHHLVEGQMVYLRLPNGTLVKGTIHYGHDNVESGMTYTRLADGHIVPSNTNKYHHHHLEGAGPYFHLYDEAAQAKPISTRHIPVDTDLESNNTHVERHIPIVHPLNPASHIPVIHQNHTWTGTHGQTARHIPAIDRNHTWNGTHAGSKRPIPESKHIIPSYPGMTHVESPRHIPIDTDLEWNNTHVERHIPIIHRANKTNETDAKSARYIPTDADLGRTTTRVELHIPVADLKNKTHTERHIPIIHPVSQNRSHVPTKFIYSDDGAQEIAELEKIRIFDINHISLREADENDKEKFIRHIPIIHPHPGTTGHHEIINVEDIDHITPREVEADNKVDARSGWTAKNLYALLPETQDIDTRDESKRHIPVQPRPGHILPDVNTENANSTSSSTSISTCNGDCTHQEVHNIEAREKLTCNCDCTSQEIHVIDARVKLAPGHAPITRPHVGHILSHVNVEHVDTENSDTASQEQDENDIEVRFARHIPIIHPVDKTRNGAGNDGCVGGLLRPRPVSVKGEKVTVADAPCEMEGK